MVAVAAECKKQWKALPDQYACLKKESTTATDQVL